MSSRIRRRATGTITLLALAAFASAGLHWTASAQDGKRGGRRPGPRPQAAAGGSFIRLELKDEGVLPGEGDTPARLPLAPATPLSDEETAKVLARLTAIAPETGTDFALREGSLPPPRTGKTVEAPFPPPSSSGDDTGPPRPDKAATGPLEVLRHQPDGEVPIAPHFSITFNQPMVAVTSHAATVVAIPVKLTPEIAGEWRWVGTKTLLFEPKPRFPMATAYTAEIPAGTTSAIGGKLEKAVSLTFSTPPPKLAGMWPTGDSIGLTPIFFASFDQAIDPAAVLVKARLEGGRGDWGLRLATQSEIDADATVHSYAASASDKRWLAFRPTTTLPAATSFHVVFGAGTPSAEGLRTTTADQGFNFATYGPLKIVRKWPEGEAPPWSPWTIQLSNALDAKVFDPAILVGVEPNLPGTKIVFSGNTISVFGAAKGGTTYTVTLGTEVTDVFGQKIQGEASAKFTVGHAPESFWGTEGLVVLDPSGSRSYSLYSVNEKKLKVRAFAVSPEEWQGFHALNENWQRNRTLADVPGKCVLEETISPKGEADAMTETLIDLSSAYDGGLGHAIVIVEPLEQPKEPYQRRAVIAWVESTKIAVDAFVDQEQLLAWATTLKEGKPVADAAISLVPWGLNVTTAKDGTATVNLPGDSRNGACVIARVGKDSALLPEQLSWWSSGSSWVAHKPGDSLRWWVADDRHLYRPGEEVHVKGWLRRFASGPTGDLAPLAGAAKTVHYALHDSRGNEILKGERPVDALGGWDAAFTLPPTMNLGSSWLQLEATGGTLNGATNHSIEVQEFRRPEFEVTATASAGPVLVGDHATFTVAANYYSGGGLPGADVSWNLQASEAGFTPPGCGEYSFGVWVPWWESWSGGGGGAWFQHQAKTDPSGKHTLGLDLLGLEHPRPVVISASASVMDVNRQAWAASASLLVHPASEYVGLKSLRTFVQKGEPLNVDAIVADLDGKIVTGRKIAIRAVRLDWAFEGGSYVNKEVDPFEATLESGKDPVRTTFTPKEGGTYRVRARIQDPKERPNESELTLWVAGGKTQPSRNVEQERVTLVPDKRDYKAGDTAEVLVIAPFANAEALVSLERMGFVATKRITLEGSSTTIKIPVEDGYTPNLHVRVDLVGQSARLTDAGVADPKLPPRPAFAVGELDLKVPPTARKLALEVKPRDAALAPGGETTVDVSLRDASGKPVEGGEVALVAVDESVLALSGYRLPDLLAAFYPELSGGVATHYLRPHVLLANPEDALKQAQEHASRGEGQLMMKSMAGGAPGAPPPALAAGLADSAGKSKKDEPGGGGDGAAIAVRANFNALALFAAALPTDAAGHAEIKLKLPDSLTRYRLMAVGVAGDKQFGQGESQITARLPLMVRPSPPRFLNFGDQFEMPVVLQNQTDAALTVDVAIRATNCSITGASGLRVSVPANDRVEVRFPAAAVRAGKARFQVGASSGPNSDAAELTLPVWTPATTEAFATYGEIDEGSIVQPVAMPGAVVKEFGGLEVETSSTAVQALTDAVLYLVRYPFECSEQLSSRVLAIASLKDVLGAFHAEGLPSPETMNETVKLDIARLHEIQGWDGGFAFWRKGDPEWPYLSIHVAHALARAKAKGYEVPEDMLQRSLQHLKQIENYIPPHYGKEYRRVLVAYSLYVRKLLGDRDPAKARAVLKDGGLETLSLEAVGWLLSVLSSDKGSQPQVVAIRKHLENRVSEEAGTAHWTTRYGDDSYLLLASDRRTDGVLLDALIEDSPKSDMIPKVVRGLLAHRTAGHWTNTQENAFVLIALDRYFATYEKETPDFVAKAWLGDKLAGEHTFKGRSTERAAIKVPMSYLATGDVTKDLTIGKEGPGRLYYRIGMRYAPASLSLEPSDHGFTVTRSYEAVEHPEDVKRDDAGVWHVRAGAKVRVRVTMVAPTRRYHVALVDALPAGLEAMNPSLAVTGPVPQDTASRGGGGWWWRSVWFEHQNLRDERAEAFTSLLWEGVHEYSYVCRATTPGTFVVPPAKAEEMYQPETFGRSGTDRLVVEAGK